jgi:cytochrome c5
VTAPPTTATLIATPGTVSPGGTVTVMVANGPANRNDWVALYAAGGSTYLNWKYLNGSQTMPATGVTGATVTFVMPTTMGTYSLRFYTGTTLLATTPVTVGIPSSPTVTVSATTVAPGGAVTATVANGPANPTDWLGLYATGGATFLNWKYLNGTQSALAVGVTSATVTFTMPTTPGTYTLRFSAGSVVLATSATITVTMPAGSPTITATPATVSPGGTVTVAVGNGPANRNDWVALYATGGSTYLSWKYLNGLETLPATGMTGATLAFVMPTTPGSYTMRFYTGTTLLATSEPVTVAAPNPTFTVSATTVAPGEAVTATVSNGPANRNDWIAVYAAGGTMYLDWKYLNGSQSLPLTGVPSASVPFTMPTTPGSYTLKLHAGSTLLATGPDVVVQ